MPDGLMLAEGLDCLVKDLDRNIIWGLRGLQRGRIATSAGQEEKLLDRSGQIACQRLLDGEIAIGVVLPGRTARLAVEIGQQFEKSAVCDRNLLASA